MPAGNRQRTFTIVQRKLAHMLGGAVLHVFHSHQPRGYVVEYGTEQPALGSDCVVGSFGFFQNLLDYGYALFTVSLQQFWLGLPFHHHGQLPAEIDHILHSRIHTLRARGSMNMGRVSTEKHSPSLKVIHHAAVDAKPRTPAHVTEFCRNVGALIVDLLKLVQRWPRSLGLLADRVVGHHSKTAATHGKHTHEPVRGRENVEIRLGKVTIYMEVAQGVDFNVRFAFEVKSDRTTSNTVGTLRID